MLSHGMVLLYLVVITITTTSIHAAEGVGAAAVNSTIVGMKTNNTPNPTSTPMIPTKYIGMNAQAEPVFMPLLGIGTWQYGTYGY